jgi:dethiobiotin synthetase
MTGTDTEIGKTLISCALLNDWQQRGLTVAGMKPVAAGANLIDGRWVNDDVRQLRQVCTSMPPQSIPHELINPYLLRTPVAPQLAASLQGQVIELGAVHHAYRQLCKLVQAVVVEGVGGFCVPLNDSYDTADLAQQLGLPVVLVVGLRLGCINHALLTAQAIAAKGLRLVAWVANTVDPAMTQPAHSIAVLHRRLQGYAPSGSSVVLAGHVPWLANPTAHEAQKYLDWSAVCWTSESEPAP